MYSLVVKRVFYTYKSVQVDCNEEKITIRCLSEAIGLHSVAPAAGEGRLGLLSLGGPLCSHDSCLARLPPWVHNAAAC